MERNTETFNEKCDRVLKYLNDRPSPSQEITHLTKFTADTGITPNDKVLEFLKKEKNYIEYNSYDIKITGSGAAFIANNSFHQVKQDADLNSSLIWYNHADAKQRFDDYPKAIRQRNNAYYIAAVTLIIAILTFIFKK